ncbi:HD domain-containing protein [Anaeroselena agilis]|uniref:HD domain-containing protein n=1 Tax=Anaeroselena agilis TaxID=3063788 RepID=A0ABU3NTP9_9FIRM|nr:HD domain-containing protein [Selenomonadales bacterium 4137-cl]
MWRRVKQVLAALTARVTAADREFVAAWLAPAERELFYAMNLPDQYHALQVAYTARRLAAGRGGVDYGLLTRCALLHDVGKVKGDVSTFDKTFAVLAHRLAPGRAEGWGRAGRGGRIANLRHALHVYFRHPERSAALLAGIGANERLVGIISSHHQPPAPGEPPELTILREADDMH